jgi:ATP-dependent DNA helicase RecG
MATMSDDLADQLGTQQSPSLEFEQDAADRTALREAIRALANDLADAGVGDLVIGVRQDGSPGTDVHGEALLNLATFRDVTMRSAS